MTLGQLLESMLGIWCAKRGTHADGTIFNNHNIESVMSELEKMGFNNAGYQKLYSGFTGEYINTLIYTGPTYYQRLMKFTSDTVYAVSKGRTDELTRQPLVGKARHGEMNAGVEWRHSASLLIESKKSNGKTAKLFGKSLKL